MSNLEWKNGKKTKSTKSKQKPEKFVVQEDFATLRKFRNAGNFHNAGNFGKVAKFRKLCEIPSLRKWQEFLQFRNPCEIFATIAKMTATLFLTSAASRLCSDDLLSTLFLH